MFGQDDEGEGIWDDRPEAALPGEEGEQAFEAEERQQYYPPQNFTTSNRPDPRHDVDEYYDEEEYDEEEYDEEEYYDDDEAYSLDNAQRISLDEVKLKLEQAKLYEMLIGFDMFGEVDVHPNAIAKVKEEMKFFLMDRLEVLMGQKEDEFGGAQNFTALEVQALKQVAAKITDGYKRRENIEHNRHTPEVDDEEEKPARGLKKLGAPKSAPKPAPRPTPRPAPVARSAEPVKKPAPPARRPAPPARRPEPTKRAAPPARKKGNKPIPTQLKRKGNSRPEPSRKPIPKNLTKKHPYEMNEDELFERNQYVKAGQSAKSVNSQAKPMPTFEQEYSNHQVSQTSPSLQNMMTILQHAKRV